MRIFYVLIILVAFVAGCDDDEGQVAFEPSFIGTLGEDDYSFSEASVGLSAGIIFGGASDTTEIFTFGGRFATDDGVRISIGFREAPGIESFENLIGTDLITSDTFPQLHSVALIIAGNIANLSDNPYSDNLLVIDRVQKTTRPNLALVPVVESGNIIEIEGRVKFEYMVEGEPTILEGVFKAEAFEIL